MSFKKDEMVPLFLTAPGFDVVIKIGRIEAREAIADYGDVLFPAEAVVCDFDWHPVIIGRKIYVPIKQMKKGHLDDLCFARDLMDEFKT